MQTLLRAEPASYVLGAALSVLVGSLALFAFGADPVAAWNDLVQGAVGSQTAIGNTLTFAAPIALCGLAVVIPLRAQLLNIGGQGQLLLGAVGCAAVAPVLPHVAVLGAIVLLLAGALAGALWATAPALGRAHFGVNEVVSTILLNFAAAALLSWAVDGPLRETGGALPQTNPIPGTFLLPKIGSELQIHVGVPLAAALVMGTAVVLARTRYGYRLRIVGGGTGVARYLGVSERTVTMSSLIISGGFAGLAGAMQILGVQGLLIDGFLPGFAFDGLAAAFLGGGGVVGTTVAALILGGLHAGGNILQIDTQLPTSAVTVLEAIVVVVTLAARGAMASGLLRRQELAGVS